MNPYDILNIPHNSNKEEIRKAYLKLALKYHPDRDKSNNDKFIEIQNAYQILINNYDNHKNPELYYNIKNFFINKYPHLSNSLYNIIKSFYKDNNDFIKNQDIIKQYINNYDIPNIYNHILNTINNINLDFNINQLHITKNISISLSDLYFNNHININIHRNTKNNYNYLLIPIDIFYNSLFKFDKNNKNIKNNNDNNKDDNYNDDNYDLFNDITIVIHNEGEIKYGISGNIILNISFSNTNYTIINICDLFINIDIPIYDYLYGGYFLYKHIDNIEYVIHFDNFIENENIISFDNMGLYKINNLSNTSEFTSKSISNFTSKFTSEFISEFNISDCNRGKLFIKFSIHNLENPEFKKKIKNIL